jgi:membrane protein YqaA with SNARE-associated domain
MSGWLAWLKGIAVALGAPGLFVISFLDSSFLSFPQVCDILVITLTIAHKERMLLYAFMATAGSVAGCYALYAVAKRGGEAFVRKRLHERHIERAMELFRKYGLLAIAVPSILPPPVPFKLFVLSAGIADVRPRDFILACTIGRSVRYFGEGLLALWYGEAAIAFLRENYRTVSLALGALIAAGVLVYMLRRRRTAL